MINYYYSRGKSGNRKLPFGNPVANALVVVVGTLAIAASVVLGFIALLAIGSLVLVLAAIIGIRVWWLNRKLARDSRRRSGNEGDSGAAGSRARIHVIEGEYRDVSASGGSQKP